MCGVSRLRSAASWGYMQLNMGDMYSYLWVLLDVDKKYTWYTLCVLAMGAHAGHDDPSEPSLVANASFKPKRTGSVSYFEKKSGK